MASNYDFQNSFGYRLSYIARLNERGFETRIAADKLTRLGWAVMCAIEYEGLHRPSNIAAFIGVDRAAVSRTLRRLEDDGRLKSEVGDVDGRSRRVMLTDAGRDVLNRATASAQANAEDFAERFNAEERRIFFEAMGRILEEDRASNPLKAL
ncbi:MAG: MarR family winged helix-turn-helix transcriptional regulator [Pseudomonadota bacterium]